MVAPVPVNKDAGEYLVVVPRSKRTKIMYFTAARVGIRVEIYEQSGAMYLRSCGDYLRLIYNRGARITSVVILRPGVSRLPLFLHRESFS